MSFFLSWWMFSIFFYDLEKDNFVKSLCFHWGKNVLTARRVTYIGTKTLLLCPIKSIQWEVERKDPAALGIETDIYVILVDRQYRVPAGASLRPISSEKTGSLKEVNIDYHNWYYKPNKISFFYSKTPASAEVALIIFSLLLYHSTCM